MAADQRRTRDQLGEGLVMALQNCKVMEMYRLINQGADVNYVFRWRK